MAQGTLEVRDNLSDPVTDVGDGLLVARGDGMYHASVKNLYVTSAARAGVRFDHSDGSIDSTFAEVFVGRVVAASEAVFAPAS